MGRYSEQYTEEQRTAVGSAMLDPDTLSGKPLTAKQATERLNAGRLGVPPPAKPMPVTSAYDYKRREQRRRAGHELSPAARQALEAPADVAGHLLQRAVSIHERLMAKAEAQLVDDKPDLRLVSTVMRNQVQLQPLLKPRQPTPKKTPVTKQPGDIHEKPDEPRFTSTLLEKHKASLRAS